MSKTDPDLSPSVLLARMYSRTRQAVDGTPRQRSIVLQEGVDRTMEDVDRMFRKGSDEAISSLLSDMEMEKVHPEMLDVIVAMVEDMSLPPVEAFRKRVAGRQGQVDEILRPIKLHRNDGTLVSHDVRKDARAIYREKAKMFGDALRRDGNLDRFYKSDRMKARSRGEVADEGADGGSSLRRPGVPPRG